MKHTLVAAVLAILGLPALASAESFVAQIPAHQLGCLKDVRPVADRGEINKAIGMLTGTFVAAKLDPGAAEPIMIDAGAVKVCLQLGEQPTPSVAGIDVVQVPVQTARLLLCGLDDATKCRDELVTGLGGLPSKPIYAVPVFRWKEEGRPLKGDVSHEALAGAAAGKQPLAEPSPSSVLAQTNWLLVAPLPAEIPAVADAEKQPPTQAAR